MGYRAGPNRANSSRRLDKETSVVTKARHEREKGEVMSANELLDFLLKLKRDSIDNLSLEVCIADTKQPKYPLCTSKVLLQTVDGDSVVVIYPE